MIKRLIRVLALTALLVPALAVPVFADQGGVKPFNYGDCVSAVAAGPEEQKQPAANEAERTGKVEVPKRTPREYTALTAPNESRGFGNPDVPGSGNRDDYNTGCRNFSPG